MSLFLVLSFIFPPMAVFAEDVTRSPYDPALTTQENNTPSSDSGSGSNFAGNTAKGVAGCGASALIGGALSSAIASVKGFLSNALSGLGLTSVLGKAGVVVPVGAPTGSPAAIPAGAGTVVQDPTAIGNLAQITINTDLTVTNTGLVVGNTANTAANTNTTAGNTTLSTAKETILDCIAREVARAALREMTDSLVSWINGGFEGSPLFLEDPMAFFQGIEDSVSGILLKELGLTRLCSLSANDLKLALGLDFGARRGIRERYACTLRDLEMNVDEIFNDLSSRSLQDYLDVTTNPNNNFWGAYFGFSEEINRTIAAVSNNKKDQLNQGGGFLSAIGIDGKIVTPGKVIEDQLSNVLGSEVRQLELADEINEVVAALINALINKVMSAGKGLRN